MSWFSTADTLAIVSQNGTFSACHLRGGTDTQCSLETYGAKVDQVKAEIGAAVEQQEIETALKAKKYKAITFTHVDTSTGVLSDAKTIAETVRRVSPETLVSIYPSNRSLLMMAQVIMDGVCSVASEEIKMDDWDIDVVLTASQKGLGTPPGLSILVASKNAIKVRLVHLFQASLSFLQS